MLARLALAAELPPRPGRAAVRVGDGGDEGVQQARVVPAAVERAQALEKLLGGLAREVAGPLDSEPDELARHRRPDVGDGREIAHTPRSSRAGRAASCRKRPSTAARWGRPPPARGTRARSAPGRRSPRPERPAPARRPPAPPRAHAAGAA